MKTLLAFVIALLPLTVEAYSAEQVLGYTYDTEGIAFQVSSGGCTEKENFVIKFNKSLGYKTLALYREAQDVCLGYFPYGTQIFFSYEEIGIEAGEKFRVLNSLGVSRRDPL